MMSLELQFYGDSMHRNYLNWLISIKMTQNYELSMDVNYFIDMYHVVTECWVINYTFSDISSF